MPLPTGVAYTPYSNDLRERGLDQDVTVVVMGEFGRTPKINGNAGRDHWNEAGCVLLAGGSLRMGQVIGTTDSRGERSRTQPIRYQNIFATLYLQRPVSQGMKWTPKTGQENERGFCSESRNRVEVAYSLTGGDTDVQAAAQSQRRFQGTRALAAVKEPLRRRTSNSTSAA